ncbi:MAG: hypothetical protein AB7O59_24885 [Pirellulales bacterium]
MSAALTTLAIVVVAVVNIAHPSRAVATTEHSAPPAGPPSQLRPRETPILFACEDSPQALSIAVLVAGSAAAAMLAITFPRPVSSHGRSRTTGRRD